MSAKNSVTTGNLVLSAFLALHLGNPAFGSERGSHDLSAAAGISTPASTTAPFQNPAGLTYQSRTALSVMGAFANDSFQDPLIEGGLSTGNGSLGAGLGIQKPTTDGSSESVYYGLGFQIPNLGSSIGISGSTFLNGGGTAWNAGALLGSNGSLRFGMTIHNFTSSSREWGAGIGYDMGGDFSLIADATLDHDLNNPWLQPALLLRGSSASLTLGYGLSASSNRGSSSSQISEGFTAGASIKFGQGTALQAYYKQLSHFLFELTFSL